MEGAAAILAFETDPFDAGALPVPLPFRGDLACRPLGKGLAAVTVGSVMAAP